MTLNITKKIKLIMNEIISIILEISFKSNFAIGLVRFSVNIQAYSKIPKIIMHCTPVIHNSILLNPLLEGALIEP